MHEHLLRPMGVDREPRSVPEAIGAYRGARDRLESQMGVTVSRRLELEVLPAVSDP